MEEDKLDLLLKLLLEHELLKLDKYELEEPDLDEDLPMLEDDKIVLDEEELHELDDEYDEKDE